MKLTSSEFLENEEFTEKKIVRKTFTFTVLKLHSFHLKLHLLKFHSLFFTCIFVYLCFQLYGHFVKTKFKKISLDRFVLKMFYICGNKLCINKRYWTVLTNKISRVKLATF